MGPAFGGVGTCIGWGDPHVRTFDGMRADYYSSGEYYIVKSPVVSIQGRYLPTKFTNGLAVTKMVAIGGPLLKGNKLIIGPLATTWNGAPILTGFPSHFDQPGIVHVKIADGTPEGLLVQVNRWTASSDRILDASDSSCLNCIEILLLPTPSCVLQYAVSQAPTSVAG